MNEKKKNKILEMIARIDEIINRVTEMEAQFGEQIGKVHPNYSKSATNLVHYRALRSMDIRNLQKWLGNMGLSRLAKTESHVMASLVTNKGILEGLIQNQPCQTSRHHLSFKKAGRLLRSNAKALLGYRVKGRRPRIMVTLPSEAAENYELVHDMMTHGMNCARINCAHDDKEAWKKMINKVREASKNLKRNCKVAMDLAGPKIRTGPLLQGSKVRKYRPAKDIRGYVTQALKVWLAPEPHPNPEIRQVPISLADLKGMKKGDGFYFMDAGNKKRKFSILEKVNNGCLANCKKTTYLETGMPLFKDRERKKGLVQVGEFLPVQLAIVLNKGDYLRLHKAPLPGESAQYDKQGKLLSPAHISCTAPEIVEQVKAGEPILFDDGKIKGIIREISEEELLIEIVHTREGGAKLRADKGINLPDSQLTISGLTEKDKSDLEFVARHADVVNMSFVNSARDVQELIKEIEKHDAGDKLGVILKIETQYGFNNLTNILLEAMQIYPLGVMIARGDLAIECGWENIGRVQEEILSICQAAHMTDIWATQVLETMAKQGIPSRAEITDAAMAQRADCVMLNKGPYILEAIQLLSTILKDLESYQDKNAPMTPVMEAADKK